MKNPVERRISELEEKNQQKSNQSGEGEKQ